MISVRTWSRRPFEMFVALQSHHPSYKCLYIAGSACTETVAIIRLSGIELKSATHRVRKFHGYRQIGGISLENNWGVPGSVENGVSKVVTEFEFGTHSTAECQSGLLRFHVFTATVALVPSNRQIEQRHEGLRTPNQPLATKTKLLVPGILVCLSCDRTGRSSR